ncbi:putative transcription factor-like protein [Trypanosoma grayi]|uniref:putative transcription factor-like protein n=1 Tax=Trypanosoma grayi TaxID=71804 RepID=UPI0004F40FEE|nr:putative transcription factor-like protein [Trypanosoma grayi]KEG10731.1 putative transcription factor-like protein [Trypanosoma grayi]
MRAEKRAFVHSLCQYYYIHSESVDPEPNRSCLLTRTPKIRIPVPLLSEAVAEDEKHNPSNFVKEICGNNELFYSRVIVMKGENVNTVSVSRVLEEFIGDFVCDAEEMLSDGTKRLKVFFTHQTKQQHAYRHLRSTGPPFQFFIPRMTEEQPLKEKKVLGSSSWANSVWCRRNNPK